MENHMKTRMRLCSVLLCFAVISPAAAQPDAKTQAELAWPKSVATDCLEAILHGNYRTATVLVTADFKKALSEEGTSVLDRFRDAGMGEPDSWVISVYAMAPGEDEASIRGYFKGKKGVAAFSMRIAKDYDKKWRISFITVGRYKENHD
jgi:hypothetical protein